MRNANKNYNKSSQNEDSPQLHKNIGERERAIVRARDNKKTQVTQKKVT